MADPRSPETPDELALMEAVIQAARSIELLDPLNNGANCGPEIEAMFAALADLDTWRQEHE